MEPVIEVKGLKHIYTDSDNNRITALEQIDLQIMPGEKYPCPSFERVAAANGRQCKNQRHGYNGRR